MTYSCNVYVYCNDLSHVHVYVYVMITGVSVLNDMTLLVSHYNDTYTLHVIVMTYSW